MTNIQLKITNEMLKTFGIPEYATSGSAGLDLRACIENPIIVRPNETIIISSGISINIQNQNIAAIIIPRSGLGSKHGIVLSNLIGLIDSDYQGEIGISVWNRSDFTYNIKPGDRLCQMVFIPVIQTNFEIVTEFESLSIRGESGWGSTGI